LNNNFSALNEALQATFDYNQIPVREPSTFSGDPLKFVKWKRSFESLIGNKRIKASDKLALLERYVTGEAAECIDGMFYRSDEDAYQDAWAMLNERYGHSSVIISAFRTKLSSWPKIGGKEYLALRKFADFLVTIDNAIPHISGLKNLNDEEENRKLLQKLPDWIIVRWGNIVADHDNKGKDYPSFHQFVEFLTQQAKIATRPVCSLQALKGERPTERKAQKDSVVNKNSTTLMVSSNGTENQLADAQTMQTVNQNPTIKEKKCVFCKKPDHYLPNCNAFMKETLEHRKQFIKNERRCFKCLRTGHGARDCKRPHECQKCKGKHPSCLHDDNRVKAKRGNENQETVVEATNNKISCSKLSSSSSTTLPVWLSSKHDPHNEKLVYALIDSQSDTTFVDHSIAEQLNAPREPTRLKIGTITSGNQPGVVCDKIEGLQVRSYYGNILVDLPPVYTIDHIPLRPSSIPTRDMANNWSHLQRIAEDMPPLLNCEPGVLIGFNCSHAFLPRECITGGDLDPFAVKTDLGWGIIGKTSPGTHSLEAEDESMCRRIITKEFPLISPNDACQVLERDFQHDQNDGKKVSQEDIQFLHILEKEIQKDDDGHYQMPLPFKKTPTLPNNYSLAAKRLDHLKRKLSRNEEYFQEYSDFMKEIMKRGDAEEASNPNTGQEWYIPHHGVYHPQKKKLRVVFDCSAKFQNTSLNDHLLVGPNLINNLVGVLSRFRQYPVAVTCDVEKMFHQFRVDERQRDFLRFLWWENGDMSREPTTYRMKVHLFGATSSPGCANFGLKHMASANKDKYPDGARFVEEDFYVDDGLASEPTEEKAISLVQEAVTICAEGGLRLHKFASNSRAVMEAIPASERAPNMQTLDLSFDELPIERTLGMLWSVESDSIQFSFSPADRPPTRRNILAIVASLYDPLGLIAPFVLTGKSILQEICHKGVKWDDPVPAELLPKWVAWKADLEKLKQLVIPRCYYPTDFGHIVKIQLHHFSDASFKGYGMCSYLRFENDQGAVHCSLVAAKARVAPRKVVSIPRLELTAALVAAEIGSTIKHELRYKIDEEFFWTDSQVVLGYINNEARKFHVFVANSVQQIKELTESSQWHYVATDANPADYASRGLNATELLHSKWFSGPDFLWQRELQLPPNASPELDPKDPEIRVVSLKTETTPVAFDLDSRLARFSDWNQAVRVVARLQRLTKPKGNKCDTPDPTVMEREKAKLTIIQNVQAQFFPTEMSHLTSGCPLPKKSSLRSVDPFLQDGMRVGGRLRNSSLSVDDKHPIILPQNCHVTRMIIKHCHEKVRHQGRGMTLNEIRSQGYWIIGGSKQVAKHIKKCVTCRKLRGPNQEQKMADLPKERVEPSPPFTYVGMDCFGPVLVKNGRKETKRYGLLFTCFNSRAVHVEMVDDLSTDAFINSLRCFIAVRGAVQQIWCDQGTNFVGANHELKTAMKELNTVKVSRFLADNQCEFKFNTPNASHAGGVWERQIGTVKSVLKATLAVCPGRLDDSSLRTLFYEVMAIVNSRPLTAINQSDPTSPEPLTPNHILTMKSKVPLPPPGNFVKEDLYLRKRWRRVQYLAEQFWSRWKREYVSTITLRQKWLQPRRNLTVGDVVLVADQDIPRNDWQLAKVIAAPKDKDGLVRHVTLNIGSKDLDKFGRRKHKPSTLERPIQKLVLILEA